MQGPRESLRKAYPVQNWKGIWSLISSWSVIILAWALCQYVSFWFYPVSALLVANRLLAISLIGHEALHGNLFSNPGANKFFGRYLCCFPCGFSFLKYQKLHMLHHRTLGSELYDPDFHLYRNYPMEKWSFLKRQLSLVLTGRMFLSFLEYYTELPEFLRKKKNQDGKLFVLSKESDWIRLIFFWMMVITSVVSLGIVSEFIFFYLIPFRLVTEPYVIFMGGLQHGPFEKRGFPYQMSRTVTGPKSLMWLLLPLNINFHGEHHLSPTVPQYWLPKYSRDLKDKGVVLFHQTYGEAIRRLFSRDKLT